MTKSIKKTVVIGAGPAGLCTAWNLQSAGQDVTVLEKADRTGGLAVTFRDGGYLFDLGPHNFHTTHKDILSFVKKILKNGLRQHHPTIKIFFRGKFVRYPLSGVRVFTVLPFGMMVAAGLSFLLARLKLFLREPKNDDSFENWIENRFGPVLYGIYFRPYAEKVWMIKPTDISKYVAEKRVPVLSISNYISRLLRRSVKKHHAEDIAFIENYYPVKGIGQVTEWLHGRIAEGGGRIELGSETVAINGEKNSVRSATYRKDGVLKTVEADMFFSTMPLNELVKAIKMDVPDAVRRAAEKLDYVSEVLFFLKVNGRRKLESSLLYFSDPAIKFNRIYNVGSFSRECVPEGKTAFCVEFTCNKGDDIWNSGEEALYDYIMDVMEKNRIMSRSEVEGHCVKRITHAYPRFRVGFEKNVRKILDYLSGIDNIVVLGRQGLFCYANVDDALYMGFRAVEASNSIKIKGIDYAELFPQHIYF